MITQKRAFQLPDKWDDAKVEFIVGDVQSLPFPKRLFSSLCSLNLVDKVPSPLQHLQEMDRVAELSGAQFLFSDPFSWTTDMAEPEDWLGGTDFGPYAGRGLDNIVSLLEGRKRGLGKPWTIGESGRTWWKIRNHCNHFELIRSCFIKAHR
jgi:hypothetical protein